MPEPSPMTVYLLVLTVQRPVNRWTAPFTIARTVGIGTIGLVPDVEKAYELMLDEAIAEGVAMSAGDWSGCEREDVIVLHWSASPTIPMGPSDA